MHSDAHNTADCGHVGCRIRMHRILAGWSAAELGRRAGVHPATIRRIEHGDGKASLDTLQAVALALGIGVGSIVD